MLASPIFTLTQVFEPSLKIASIDYFDHKLYLGDELGNVNRYVVRPEDPQNILATNKPVTQRPGKGKVTAVKHLQTVNQVLVSVDKQLFLLDGESLNPEKNQPFAKDVEIWTLDEDPRGTNEKILARLLIQRTDSKIAFYDYERDKDKGQFVLKSDNTKVLVKVTTIAWFGQNIFLGVDKGSYKVMDYETKKLKDIEGFKDLTMNKHTIKIVSEEETLFLGPSDFFIPIGTTTCDRLFKNPIQIASKIIGMNVIHPYIILLSESQVFVYNKLEVKNRPSRLLQELTFDSKGGSTGGRGISSNSDQVFFAGQTKVFYLSPIPYEVQINRCLNEGKVDDAFMVLDQYISEDHPDRTKKLDQLKIDAAWVQIRDLKFRDAEDTLKELNFDIREILAMFLSYLPGPSFYDVKGRQHPTMAQLIEEAKKRNSADSDLKKESTKAQRYAKEFLIKILENRRKYFLDNYSKNLKDVPTFITSESQSPFEKEVKSGKIVQHTVENLLELIDFALIRTFLETKKDEQLVSHLNKSLYCKNHYNELQQYFQGEGISEITQAKFHEQFGYYKEALEVWTKTLFLPEKSKTDRACEEIVKILTEHTISLKEVKDPNQKNLIFDTLEKVILKEQTSARNFFMKFDEKIIPPNTILSFLDKKFPTMTQLKETFFEVLVNEKKIEDETFHTNLAVLYLEKIFKEKDKNQQINQKELVGRLGELVNKFSKYIREPTARYSADYVLGKLKDSWLIDDEVFLNGKVRNHDAAITKLLSMQSYDKAERYCAEHQEKLLTKLFERYIIELKKATNDNAKKALEERITLFLKKYASHPQLDPAEALERIPDEWDLMQNGVYMFLFYALSNTLHNRRNAKVAKYVSQMDALNTEYKLLKAQSAHVNITYNRKCALCNKTIGRTVFVVYPNGIVAHHTCTQDKLSICPVTKQNFEKTFSG